jgi:hypothetical protein
VCAFVHKSWHKIARTLTNTEAAAFLIIWRQHFCSSLAARAGVSSALQFPRKYFCSVFLDFLFTLVNFGVLQRCFLLGKPSSRRQRCGAA